HHDPDLAGAHRALQRPGRGARTPDADDGAAPVQRPRTLSAELSRPMREHLARLPPLWLAWALLAAVLAPPAACAQSPAADINLVKAAYLYRFTGYVEWPPAAFAS